MACNEALRWLSEMPTLRPRSAMLGRRLVSSARLDGGACQDTSRHVAPAQAVRVRCNLKQTRWLSHGPAAIEKVSAGAGMEVFWCCLWQRPPQKLAKTGWWWVRVDACGIGTRRRWRRRPGWCDDPEDVEARRPSHRLLAAAGAMHSAVPGEYVAQSAASSCGRSLCPPACCMLDDPRSCPSVPPRSHYGRPRLGQA